MSFLKIPNLPKSTVTKAIVSEEISKESEYRLNSFGIELIKVPKSDKLYDAVKSHADMRVFHACDSNIIAEPDLENFIRKELPSANICSGDKLTESYPGDIAYNAARVGEFLICNKEHTDENIIKTAENHGLTIIDVRQGYAKCNTAIIAENAVITSDIGIYKSLQYFPLDVLITEDNSIILKNLNHGFLGGAAGKIAPDKLAVNGNINFHKNKDDIIKFASKYNVEIISLNKDLIEDIGSILPILEK